MIRGKLKSQIIKEIDNARKGNYLFKEIKRYKPNPDNKHEMIFFIKPELTGPNINISLFLDIISKSFDKYSVSIDGIFVLGADYLKRYNIISKHYGVIYTLAKKGVEALSDEARAKFISIFNINPDEVITLGAYQFLDKYRFFNPKSLDVLWENTNINRLASGTYCSKLKLHADNIYLINGFMPSQLSFFTDKGKSIVVMVVSSYNDWKILREEMIGFTDPKKAYERTIRRTILDEKELLNIKEVSQSRNGVHLSAGPIEALAELVRFASRYDKNQYIKPSDTAMGKKIINAGIPEDKLEWLITNPKVNYLDKNISIFDLTEGLNLEDTIGKIKNIL